MSFELTAVHYTQYTLALFPFFALFLFVIVWRTHKNVVKRVIAGIPLVISITLSSIMAVDALRFARENLADYDGWFLDAFIIMTLPSWAGSNLLFVIFFTCLLYALYLSCENIIDSWRVIGIMMLGFISQLVLGLAPSLYGSALRTFVYASFAIIICAVYLYENGGKAYLRKPMKIMLVSACSVNFVITFAIGIVRMSV